MEETKCTDIKLETLEELLAAVTDHLINANYVRAYSTLMILRDCVARRKHAGQETVSR